MADLVVLTDGTDTFRIQVRAHQMCTDKALTATGFDGDESTDEGATGDWIELDAIPPAE